MSNPHYYFLFFIETPDREYIDVGSKNIHNIYILVTIHI